MIPSDWSYDYYVKLIDSIKKIISLVDFQTIASSDKSFFILRHDVEFSVEKAYEMALIEHEQLHINTSYFFQIRNYAYNPFAHDNINLIKKIHAMGHHIGLHVHTSLLKPSGDISAFISNEVDILQKGLGLPIDRFSFHRPTHEYLKLNLKIKGLINTYDEQFFHFYHDKAENRLKVYYFSDSEHQWKYGDPLSILEKPIKKIQLLIHPYSWSKAGMDNLTNFKTLIQMKYEAMLKSMQEECHNFPKELLKNETL